MHEERNQLPPENTSQRNIEDYLIRTILVLSLVGIILIGINFLGPTIGNTFCSHNDICCGVFCSGLANYCSGVGNSSQRGKLLLIAPKQTNIKIIRIIGIAYSPTKYSTDEIAEVIQKYLTELGLQEDEANIVELGIRMNVKGYPRISTYIDRCYPENNRYIRGDNLFIDPDGLTVWKMLYVTRNLQRDLNIIPISFGHDYLEFVDISKAKPETRKCISYFCERVDGMVSIKVQNNLSIYKILFLFLLIVLIGYLVFRVIQELRVKEPPN
jgi:hypothetical protein